MEWSNVYHRKAFKKTFCSYKSCCFYGIDIIIYVKAEPNPEINKEDLVAMLTFNHFSSHPCTEQLLHFCYGPFIVQ